MSNKLRTIRRGMQASQGKVPVRMVPIFNPIMAQLEAACRQMDKEREDAWKADQREHERRCAEKNVTPEVLPRPDRVDVVTLINNTLAQAAGEFVKQAQQARAPKEGLVKIVGGGQVAQKMREIDLGKNA